MEKETRFGDYILKEQLGRGGFGIIYRAEYSKLNVERAIKILHPQYNADRNFSSRFIREAQLTARLEHPNIVHVHDVAQQDGATYIVMSLMPGGSLKELLEKEVRLPMDLALKVLGEVAAGLTFAHQNQIIHRDIKPANILIDQNGTARISDFGFAKARESGDSVSLSESGGLVGTTDYIAPEIWDGRPASPASDIYSLACMFYEMLTGVVLFSGNTPMKVLSRHNEGPNFNETWPSELPSALRPVLERGLAKEPADRFEAALDFYQAARTAIEAADNPENLGTAARWKKTLLSLLPSVGYGQRRRKPFASIPADKNGTLKSRSGRTIAAGCIGIIIGIACTIYGIIYFISSLGEVSDYVDPTARTEQGAPLAETAAPSSRIDQPDLANLTVNVPGNFQKAIGCSEDWDPTCWRTDLELQEDGTFSRTIFLPEGTIEAKIALYGDWSNNYGLGGEQNGPNYAFLLGSKRFVTFIYDPDSHLLSWEIR